MYAGPISDGGDSRTVRSTLIKDRHGDKGQYTGVVLKLSGVAARVGTHDYDGNCKSNVCQPDARDRMMRTCPHLVSGGSPIHLQGDDHSWFLCKECRPGGAISTSCCDSASVVQRC